MIQNAYATNYYINDATYNASDIFTTAVGNNANNGTAASTPKATLANLWATYGPAGTNVIGHAIIDSGSTTAVTQATASNLNATVVGTGTFAVQATLAAGATAIAKAEDVASADADVGVPAMAVRKATPANTSGTDGDY